MNDTRNGHEKWLDNFTFELAHRGVSGRDIGDAKASVESHLADSGESPEEAFGDPEAYARALEFSATPDSGFPWVILPTLLGVLGLITYLPAIAAVAQGGPVRFTGTEFGIFLVLAAAMVLVAKNIFRLVKQWWKLLLIWAAVVSLGVLGSLLPVMLDLPELEANAAMVASISVVLIVATGFWSRSFISKSEGMVPPANSEPADATCDSNSAADRLIVALVPWLITFGAAIFTAGAFLAA